MAERDYANDTTPELIKCLQVAAAVCQVYAHVVDAEMLLAAAQRLAEQEVIVTAAKSFDERQSTIAAAELRRALYEMYELQPWQQKVIEQIIPRDDAHNPGDVSLNTIPRHEGSYFDESG